MHGLLCRTGLRLPDADDEARFFAIYGRRNIGFVRLMLVVGGLLFLLFWEWDRVIDPVAASLTIWVRLLVILPSVWAAALLLGHPIGQKYPEPVMAGASMASTGAIAAICAILNGGMDLASGGLNLIVLFVCALLPMRLPWYLLFAGETIAAYWISQIFSTGYRPGMPIINALMLATALFLGSVSIAWRERSARRQFTIARELDTSRDRVDELLLSMLPREVVSRIQSGATLIADQIDEVSIVFADIVGFTELSRRLTAVELIQLLNRLFSDFDRAAVAHGMQKIKTIGDAYMAIGGLLPTPDGTAAIAAAEFAADMRRITANVSVDLGVYVAIRVGLHVGPVVAGVIGTSRPAYDCWGEAVNLASRLESASRAGEVLISANAQAALAATYLTHPQPAISLKGIGLTQVWRLGSRQTHAAPA
jgi:adenylate cyclase